MMWCGVVWCGVCVCVVVLGMYTETFVSEALKAELQRREQEIQGHAFTQSKTSVYNITNCTSRRLRRDFGSRSYVVAQARPGEAL